MTTAELYRGILALSASFWLITSLIISFQVQSFIVKRYERETDLMETIFFQEHATFTRSLPDFFSSACYGAHLLMCAWGWWLYGNRKIFRDIETPEDVTKYFSKNEIRRVELFIISSLILIAHWGIYYAIPR
jgi:hypothetical protein